MSALSSTCLLASGFALGLPTCAQAQHAKVSPTLLGSWQARHVGIKLPPALLDQTRRQVDVYGLRDLNQAVQLGEAHLTVNFRPDSTYTFVITRGGRTFRTEAGTFTMRRGRLLASAPTSPDGSSFHNQQLRHLARRTLVLSFPVGPELPGVHEEITYYRVGPVPREAE
jgi:hypothetical protein